MPGYYKILAGHRMRPFESREKRIRADNFPGIQRVYLMINFRLMISDPDRILTR